VIVFSSCGQQRGRYRREEKIMPAIKATSTAPRQRTSPQNGLPELVPYVYGQQTRRNTYAARIARRNAQGWWQPPVAVYEQKLTQTQVTGESRAQSVAEPRHVGP